MNGPVTPTLNGFNLSWSVEAGDSNPLTSTTSPLKIAYK